MANVKMSDMRAVGYCRRGVKAFLESHGIDWNVFISEGVPAELLEATGDAQALKVVDYVRKQHGQQ